MEFILTDSNRIDTGVLDAVSLDIEIGTENDFEFVTTADRFNEIERGGFIYSPGTEYGGEIRNVSYDSASGEVRFTGRTFRGMLEERIVEPLYGEAYLTISGELNLCLSGLIGGAFDSLFRYTGEDSGETGSVKVRYQTVLDDIDRLLSPAGMRLELKAVHDGEGFCVEFRAVAVRDLTDEEFSQDSGVNFSITKREPAYQYMIVLGGGELEERTVYHLRWNGGDVEQVTRIPTGVDNRTCLFDYSNAEDEDGLLASAAKRFEQLNQTDSQSVSVSNESEYELGDIVGGRDYVTGLTVAQPVTQIIIKQKDGVFTKSFRTGGRNG